MARAKSSKSSTSAAKAKSEGQTKAKTTKAKASAGKAKSAAPRTKARRQKPDVIGTLGAVAGAAECAGECMPTGEGAGSEAAAPTHRRSRHDKVLGSLTWNAELRSYHGKVDFRDRQIDVCLLVEDRDDQLDTMLSRARDVVNRLEEYADRAEAYASAKLEEIEKGVSEAGASAPLGYDAGTSLSYNAGVSSEYDASTSIGYDGEKESCCSDADCAMPPAEKAPVIAKFNRAMRLKSIELRPSGAVTFLHDDGNAFWGHLVEVSMNTEDQLTDARLAA